MLGKATAILETSTSTTESGIAEMPAKGVLRAMFPWILIVGIGAVAAIRLQRGEPVTRPSVPAPPEASMQAPAKVDTQQELLVQLLQQEAKAALDARDPATAKKKLDRAAKLDPNNAETTALLDLAESALKAVVAGRWSISEDVDRMTDSRTVVVMLNAMLDADDQAVPMTLIARCKARKFEIYASARSGLRGDLYGHVPARLRLGDEPAQQIRGRRSESAEAMFFEDPFRWARTFAKAPSAKMLLEVPAFDGRLLAEGLGGSVEAYAFSRFAWPPDRV